MNINELIVYAQEHLEDVPTEQQVKEAVAQVISENGMAPAIEYKEWFALLVLNELK